MPKKNSQKYTNEQVIKAIRETKGMLTLTARALGCDYNTVASYVAKNPAIKQALQDAKEALLDAVELTLYDKAIKERDTTALIFLAKTQGKKRGYVERQEVDNSGGLEIHITHKANPKDDADD